MDHLVGAPDFINLCVLSADRDFLVAGHSNTVIDEEPEEPTFNGYASD